MAEILPRVDIGVVRRLGRRLFLGGLALTIVASGLGLALVWPYWRILAMADAPLTVSWPGQSLEIGAANGEVAGASVSAVPGPSNHTALVGQLQKIAKADRQVQAGISVRWLGDGSSIGIGQAASFTAASTTKILTACYVLSQVAIGKASLSDQIGGQTVAQLLQQMVNQSSNDAWDTLSGQFSWQAQQQYGEGLGLNSYQYQGNQIDAADLSTLLAKLYQRQLFGDDLTSMLLGWMQNTNEERLIPAGLPPGVTVYHKYGWIDGDVHDTAILDTGQEKIVIVVLTDGSSNFDDRAALMHQIVQAVLDGG